MWSPCAFTGMYLQPHWAPCAFTGPVRDTPTILLVSLCVHRDAPTLPLGTLCFHRPSQGYTHNPTGLPVRSQGCTYTPTGIPVPSQGVFCSRPHRKPLLNPYASQFLRLPCNLSVSFTSLFSVFCLRQIFPPTLMGPVPSLIHNVSLRLSLIMSTSQIIILPTRLILLTPATQSAHLTNAAHLTHPIHSVCTFQSPRLTPALPSIFWTVSYDPVLKHHVIPFLYLSCTEVRSRNTHSCHTVMSLKSLNPNLSWSSQSDIFKVSHHAM